MLRPVGMTLMLRVLLDGERYFSHMSCQLASLCGENPTPRRAALYLYNKVKSCFFFDRRGVIGPALHGRYRCRSARPTGNRPGTHQSRASPSPSPRGPRGALPKSRKSDQFRGSPLRPQVPGRLRETRSAIRSISRKNSSYTGDNGNAMFQSYLSKLFKKEAG